MKFHV